MGWTDWIREVERDRDVLERILALLLALADLADRAACLPAPRRLYVLCILERGEAEARAFISGMALGPTGAGGAALPAADQAARLAAGFRALALVLGAMLAQVARLARGLRREAGPRAGLPIAPRLPAERQDRPFRHAARGPPAFCHPTPLASRGTLPSRGGRAPSSPPSSPSMGEVSPKATEGVKCHLR